MSDYHTELGKAVERAAKKIPYGYTLNIVLDCNSHDAVLYDDEGEECEFTSNRERSEYCSLADIINDAVEFAIQDKINIERIRNQD